LTLAAALLAEIAAIEHLIPDLIQGQSAASGMLRPRQIGAVKIAAKHRISMKLYERPNIPALLSVLLRPQPLARHKFVLIILRNKYEELRRARISAAGA
jgi:hypothetical protein